MAANKRDQNYSNFIETEVKDSRESLAHDPYWLYANIIKHHARKSLHHCNIVGCIVYASIVRGYPPMLPRDVYLNRKALRPQIFQSVTSVAGNGKVLPSKYLPSTWTMVTRAAWLFVSSRSWEAAHASADVSFRLCVSARHACVPQSAIRSIQSIKRSGKKYKSPLKRSIINTKSILVDKYF